MSAVARSVYVGLAAVVTPTAISILENFVTKLYVGNLPWTATEDELRAVFEPVGPLNSLSIVTDRDSGRSRGFAFVEMDKADASRAISQLNGTEMNGRPLKINEAQDKPRGGGGGGRW